MPAFVRWLTSVLGRRPKTLDGNGHSSFARIVFDAHRAANHRDCGGHRPGGQTREMSRLTAIGALASNGAGRGALQRPLGAAGKTNGAAENGVI